MPPIIVCTVGYKGFSVFEASVKAFAQDCELIVHHNSPSSYGDAYTSAMRAAFETHDEVILGSDDVVLNPKTVPVLMEDVRDLQGQHGDKLGFVAAMSDNVRRSQNIRYIWEGIVHPVEVVSPVFAWVSKKAFQVSQFPPINWYSDDVMCEDLNAAGFRHFVSRAYVHHAGSQTVGGDYAKLNADALPWLMEKRPQYVEKWFGGPV